MKILDPTCLEIIAANAVNSRQSFYSLHS